MRLPSGCVIWSPCLSHKWTRKKGLVESRKEGSINVTVVLFYIFYFRLSFKLNLNWSMFKAILKDLHTNKLCHSIVSHVMFPSLPTWAGAVKCLLLVICTGNNFPLHPFPLKTKKADVSGCCWIFVQCERRLLPLWTKGNQVWVLFFNLQTFEESVCFTTSMRATA